MKSSITINASAWDNCCFTMSVSRSAFGIDVLFYARTFMGVVPHSRWDSWSFSFSFD